MAQIVGYFENNVIFTEGPFVLVDACGWRIEVELVGHKCSVLPHISIYKIREQLGWGLGKTENMELAIRVCDQLNQMVRDGEIILKDNIWMAKGAGAC